LNTSQSHGRPSSVDDDEFRERPKRHSFFLGRKAHVDESLRLDDVSPSEKSERAQTESAPSAHPDDGVALRPPPVVVLSQPLPSASFVDASLSRAPCCPLQQFFEGRLMRALVRRRRAGRMDGRHCLDTRSSGQAHGGWARVLAGIYFRRDFKTTPKFELLSSGQSSLRRTIWQTLNSRRRTPTRSVLLLYKGSDPVRQDSPRRA
jgi:hypothetical protein